MEAFDTDECAVALASLPAMGPARLAAVVRAWGFCEAWTRVVAGAVLDDPDVVRSLGVHPREVQTQWHAAARDCDPRMLRDDHRRAGIDITVSGDTAYPSGLAVDIEPPMVLFSRGDLDALDGPRVAIVGTRRCTRGGRLTALEMGEGLAAAGVGVVSGLALGIDGAAHEGALRTDGARVIGVVGTGLDVVYPKRHQGLWNAVAERGVLLSESPLGGAPLPWRFPARNRIIAAVCDLVVVVESHASGGALHTADEALRRDRPIVVVPGSVRSPASAGTNGLLFDGMAPVRNYDDVLAALGFEGVRPGSQRSRGDGSKVASALDPADSELLGHIGGEPVSVDQLAAITGWDLGELAMSLLRLEADGWVSRSGSWIERVRS